MQLEALSNVVHLFYHIHSLSNVHLFYDIHSFSNVHLFYHIQSRKQSNDKSFTDIITHQLRNLDR